MLMIYKVNVDANRLMSSYVKKRGYTRLEEQILHHYDDALCITTELLFVS
jgi:hypothetical protein